MENKQIVEKLEEKYSLGFSEEIDSEVIPKGLNEEVIKLISSKKNEPKWLLDWRLNAYRHWLTLKEPNWASVSHPPIDYQDILYYSVPKKIKNEAGEIDPELKSYFEKLGVPLHEQQVLAGNIAVDAVLDSQSVGTTFKDKLEKLGVIFSSFNEAVHKYPEIVKQYLGTVVSYKDNYFAALNSAVFSDGSFCFIPKNIKCPMDLSTYFRINQANVGQFERTLIIAEEGSYVSYLEGCFLAGNKVFTPKGFVNIEEIGPTNKTKKVFDHLGQEQKVINRQEKQVVNKPIYTFDFGVPNLSFTCTEEHPIFIYRDGEFLFFDAKNIKLTDKLCIHKKQFLSIYKSYWLTTSEKKINFLTPTYDYVLIEIKNITQSYFTGTVYNLEVENTHTYNIYGFAVHNCSAPKRDENQLHAAVVEIVALDKAQVKYSTVQNWYPGDENGKGGVYNFVTKRADCRGYQSHVSWTQVETGSAITWKYPSVILRGDESTGEFYSVALTNHHQQADTGTKMIHLGKNTKSTIISKSISAGNSIGTYRGLVRVANRAENARNFTQCDSLIFGKAQVNTHPYVEANNSKVTLEHEATTSKVSDEHLFYLQQRGLSEEQAKNMLVNGFCKSVFQKLPSEFAVEAQKLLEVNLEGSLG